MDIPLFPLHAVLCPGVALPLHIFEARYRLMVGRCLAEGRPFGVVLIREGREVGRGDVAVASIGTLAEIRDADRYVDGRYDLVAVGTSRFRIGSVDAASEPYLVASVEPLEEPVGDDGRASALARHVTRRFIRYVDLLRDVDEARAGGSKMGSGGRRRRNVDRTRPSDADGGTSEERSDERSELAIPVDPALLSHLLAGVIELDASQRQGLLEAPTAEARLGALDEMLGRETVYLERGLRVVRPSSAAANLTRN